MYYLLLHIYAFFRSINPAIHDVSVGMICSILTTKVGEVVGGEDITGNNLYDAIIKIAIPIITGIFIPVVNNYINKRKSRKKTS